MKDRKKLRGGGYLLTEIKRYPMMIAIVFAISFVISSILFSATAKAATPMVSQSNVTFSIPTTIPFSVKADGSVISPSKWEIKISENSAYVAIDDIQAVGIPSDMSISAESEQSSTYSHSATHEADGRWEYRYVHGVSFLDATGGTEDDPLCWCYDGSSKGAKKISWSLQGVTDEHGLLDEMVMDGKASIGNISITLKPIYKTSFAIYSSTDNSLDIYNRIRVPRAGELYDGREATAVYTGFDKIYGNIKSGEDRNTGHTNLLWDEHRSDIISVDVIDNMSTISIDYWFQYFSNCETMNLKNLDTSKITSMWHTFRNCSALTRLDLSSWDTHGIVSFDGPFSNCLNLETIDIGDDFVIDEVHSVYGLFSGCSRLSNSSIQGIVNRIDTSQCSDFTLAFNGTSIRNINLSSWNTSKATCMMNMFSDAKSLEILDISSFDTSNIGNGVDASGTIQGSLSNIFLNCNHLRVVRLGNKFTWASSASSSYFLPVPSSSYIDGADGKWYAESDGSSYSPAFVPSNKADTYYARATTSFAVYSADDGSLDFYKRPGYPSDSDEFLGKDATHVWTRIEEESSGWHLARDQSRTSCPWWDIREAIRHVTVVDGIRPQSVEGWFYWCVNCETINLGDIDTSLCTTFYATFDRMFKIKTIDVSMLDMRSAKSVSCMFWGDNFEELDISSFDLSNVTCFNHMFNNCKQLKTLKMTVPTVFNEKSTFWCMFASCPNLILDCSDWNIDNPSLNHDEFNLGAPNVSLPACWVPTAFAVYSADDSSLDFYKREAYQVPVVGGSFNEKSVSRIYTGFETDEYTGEWPDSTVPWYLDTIGGLRVSNLVKNVSIIDKIKPRSMAWWFNQFTECESFDLGNIDTSECTSLRRLFSSCKSCVDLNGLDKWDTHNLADIGACFDGLHCLREIPGITNWDTSNIVNYNCAFFNCTRLVFLDLSSWDNDIIGGTHYCLLGLSDGNKYGSLKYIKIGDKWNENGAGRIFERSPKEYGMSNSDYWYSSDGTAYSWNDIPPNKADTYYTSKESYEEAKNRAAVN